MPESPGTRWINCKAMPAELSECVVRITTNMDAVVKSLNDKDNRPTEAEAEEAVRTLLRWVGDDINREGLLDTPKRVVKAYKELFSGYEQDVEEELGRTFEEVAGYDDIVLIKDIPFFSHCEHHMVPIIGKAHVAYLPDGKVLGLSKIARVVEIFGRRLQTQETMRPNPDLRGSHDDVIQNRTRQ